MFFIHEDKHSNHAESLFYLTTVGCHFTYCIRVAHSSNCAHAQWNSVGK